MLQELNGQVVRCVKDQNGNHVIQKCIEHIRPLERIRFVTDSFHHQIEELAAHPYGCRLVQRILENCDEATISSTLKEVVASARKLVQNQYGNYVVQHVLQHGQKSPLFAQHRQHLVETVCGDRMALLEFATHKFASNVLEKCLQYGSAPERRMLIALMLGEDDPGNSSVVPLQIMMKDPYANYVVQKVLDVAEPRQLRLVLAAVRSQAAALKRLTYGKHILLRLEEKTAEMNRLSEEDGTQD